MDNIEETIKSYLIKEHGIGDGVSYEDPLFSAGVLDSMDVITLIHFMEKTYNLTFNPFDLGLEQLDSISLMAKCIKNRLV